MDSVQVQIEYDIGKIKKFNIPDRPCTYDELKCDIQARINSLHGKEFGIQYIDDEDNWVIAISNTCIEEAFRCARSVPGTSMRRMKIKTFDGFSPNVVTESFNKKSELLPKCLFENDEKEYTGACVTEPPDIDVSAAPPSVYKSPMQMLISEIEDELQIKQVEHDSAKEFLKALEQKFSNPNIKIDKTKTQCGQCHLRLGHTKRNCTMGVCEGPSMCNDIDKHDVEKKQMIDAAQSVKSLSKELEKLQTNLALKKQTYEQTNNSFFTKIMPYLVNTNIDKYYPVGSFGLRALCMGAIHPDMAILEKHFRGKVPKNLESSANHFQNIIQSSKDTTLLRKPDPPTNPVKSFMEQRGIQFPNFGNRRTEMSLNQENTSAPFIPTYGYPGYYPTFPMPMPMPMPMHYPPSQTRSTAPDDDDDNAASCFPLPPKKRKT